jgi:hypothetical protein
VTARSQTRWTVTTRTGVHEVGAPRCDVEAGGSLVFRDANGWIVIAYSAERWTEVKRQ